MVAGGAVISNQNNKNCEFLVENNAPILRQKDILSPEAACTPCRRIYLLIQLMYIDRENCRNYLEQYWNQVQMLIKAAPSTTLNIDRINESIMRERYYQALQQSRKLIEYEEEVTLGVQKHSTDI